MEWEYKIDQVTTPYGGYTEKILNKNGKEGWELVFVSPTTLGIYIFKRPISKHTCKECGQECPIGERYCRKCFMEDS